MLLSDDRQLIARDPALPGLALVLDAETLSAALASHVPQAERPREATYVRYKPGTGCLVAYRMGEADAAGLAYARAYAVGAGEKFRKAWESRRADAGAGPVALNAVQVVFWRFPQDRRLEALSHVIDAQQRPDFLRRLFPTHPELWEASVTPLRYKPERRFVGRLEVGSTPAGLIKIYDGADFRNACSVSKRLQSLEPLRLPRRIARSGRYRAAAFEWLPGRLLSDLLELPELPCEEITRVGDALAQLHRQPIDSLRRTPRTAQLRSLRSVAENIARLLPTAAATARRLAQRVAAQLAEVSPRLAPVHGDFYASQVLLDGPTVGIIDLDTMAAGDPAEDLGTFAAHLHRTAQRNGWPAERATTLLEALLRGHACAASREHVAAYTAAGLLRIAPHPFRSREPDWAGQTMSLLAQGHAVLDAEQPPARKLRASRDEARSRVRRRTVVVTDPFDIARDPAMAFVAPALEHDQAEERLIPLLAALADVPAGLALREIRVARHKPGRRALIEYHFGPRGLDDAAASVVILGKARVKGLDRRALQAVEALWNAGFDGECQDGVSVPQPMGAIEDWQMWFQRKVPGRAATKWLAAAKGSVLAPRIAEAVAKLQRSGVIPPRRHTLRDELAILHERLPQVSAAEPAWRDRLRRTLDACDRLAAAMPCLPTCPAHRDFYADHVLQDGGRLWLLDFDLFCEADPGLDIGNFCGHLIEQGLRTPENQAALAQHGRSLEDRFAELQGEDVRLCVRGYTLLTLVRHIHLSTLFPSRRSLTPRLIEMCEEQLSRARLHPNAVQK